MSNKTKTLPLLALRGITVFPGMLLNFDVERPMSVAALNEALDSDQEIYLVTQREIGKDEPEDDDLFPVGTICTVKQMLKVPGMNIVKVLVEGISRAKTLEITQKTPYITAQVEDVPDIPEKRSFAKAQALIRTALDLFDEYASVTGSVAAETLIGVLDSEDPGFVADYITQNIYLKHTDKQLVLEQPRPVKRLELIIKLLSREMGILIIEQQIAEDTRGEMSKSQRDYYLREQMKVIQRELGSEHIDDGPEEIEAYREKILALSLAQRGAVDLIRKTNEVGYVDL